MKLLKGTGDFFALDIGTNAVRAVQLSRSAGGWSLVNHAYVPVDSKIATSDSAEASRKLGQIIMTAVGQSGIKTRDVAIGLPSHKTFTTVVDVPSSSDAELRATMKYQVDQYIPMSVDEAKVDWALLGPSLRAQDSQEVLLTSTARAYSESRLEFVEGLGYNVIAMEPDPIAMIRALVLPGNETAQIIVDMGEDSTDIAIVYGNTPRLIRTVPSGFSSFLKSAVHNLSIQEDQARQFILKFGLATDRLDGQVFRALEASLDSYVSELIKSIKFFQTRYENIPISGMMLSGFAAVVPQLGEYIGSRTSLQVQIADPWHDVSMSQEASTQLAPVATQFAAAVGLAKRSQL